MEETKYDGRFLRVTEERLNGRVYERVYGKPALIIYPFTDNHELLIIEEQRAHEIPNIRWKFVTGFHEPGTTLEDMANTELQEEIGKKAGSVKPYYELYGPGPFFQKRSYLIATGLTDSKLPNPDGEHAVRRIEAVPIPELEQRILDGRFMPSLAACVYLRLAHDIKTGTVALG